MINWWQQLVPRERMMLALTSTLLLAFVCWLGIWRPLDRAHRETVVQLEGQQFEIQWMRAAAGEVVRLTSRQPVTARDRGNQSLLALAEETARQGGLASAFRRGEPAGDGQVRIWLDTAAFGAMLIWLDNLESDQGIIVVDGDLERTGIPGMVNARLLLSEN